MRVAIVGPTFPNKGGGAQHTTELAHQLVARRHDALIESWAAQYPGFLYPGQQTIDTPEGEPFARVNRYLHWARPWGWWRAGRRARHADVLVLALLSSVQVPAYLGILAGLRAGRGARSTRVAVICHNVLPHEPKPYDRPLVRALLRRADLVLTHSEEQRALAEGLSSSPTRSVTLPPHLPSKRPETAAAEAYEPRSRLLFFGLVRPYKGLDVLLRALAAGPADVSLTVAGEFWGGEEQTRELIAELGLEDRVEIRPGYVPAADVPGLFARCDALVLPYRSATASQNVWLGHEHGVPVIATDVGALAESIRDGVDGLVVEPDSVPALAAALERFYEPGEPARMRANVRPVDPGPYWDAYVSALLERP